jgi:hypothetical protein
MSGAVPSLADAWRMTFSELAPYIRSAIRNNAHPRTLAVLEYLLKRKAVRKPRLRELEPPVEPGLKPKTSKWPTLTFKGRNAFLRTQSRRLFMQVDKQAARNMLLSPSLWPSVHKTLERISGKECLQIEKNASEFLMDEDLARFRQWLRDNLAASLSHHEQVFQYHEILAKHVSKAAALQKAHSRRVESWEKQLGTKFTILSNIQKEIVEHSNHLRSSLRVPFRIFPADQNGYALLESLLMSQHRSTGSHEERLQRFEFARSLTPSRLGIGLDDYDGYIIFFFDWTSSVLIENAQNRNAAYILHQNWEKLCRLSRQELRSKPKHLWERVIHNNPWQWKRDIERALLRGRT